MAVANTDRKITIVTAIKIKTIYSPQITIVLRTHMHPDALRYLT